MIRLLLISHYRIFGLMKRIRVLINIVLIGCLEIFLISKNVGLAWTNWIPDTGMIDRIIQSPVTANDLKPPECASLDLQNIITGNGTFFGTTGNDLILGSVIPDVVDGVEGNDCIIGGSGDDTLINGSGTSTQNVLDKFDAVSYNNNYGSQNWTTDWQEIGESDGPVFGDVNIEVSVARGVFTPYTNQDTYIDERNPNKNYGTSEELKVRGQTGDKNLSLFRFDVISIPPDSNVVSAIVYFYATHKISSPVYLHRVTSDWTENNATWNNFNNAYDPNPIGSLIPIANFQIYSVNITNLVQQWVNGLIPNQGVVLIASSGAVESRFASKEYTGTAQDPYILVDISQGGGANTAYTSQDTYLEERFPTNNYGTAAELRVKPYLGDQKRALLQYDLSMIPSGSTVQSAIANFYNTQANNNPVYLHQITNDWTETGATWNNSANAYNPVPIGAFTPASSNQYYPVNVTSIVQQWVNDSLTNHGLMLLAAPNGTETRYSSKEQTGSYQDPYVTIFLAPGGSKQALRIQNANLGAWRQVDLSSALSAQLQMDYLRQGLDDLNDFVSLAISNDGGATWVELTRFTGPSTDTQFQTVNIDISNYLSSFTQIRLISSESMAVDDRIYLDNITITYLGKNQIGAASILLGSAGDDILEGKDAATCYGGEGNDIFIGCSVIFDP